MKKIVSYVLMLSMVLGMLPGVALAANMSLPFEDIAQDSWYEQRLEQTV